MIRTISCLLLVGFAALFTACSVNIFDGFGDPDTDDALFYKAKAYIDETDYVNAIAQFPLMSTGYLEKREVLALRATAYAGRAGLNTLSLTKAMSTYAGTSFFIFLMQAFEGGSASTMADFLAAQNYMLRISTDMTLLTKDELALLAMISFGHMGTILSRYADTNSNGAVDAAFDSCADFPSGAAPADSVQQFGVSLNYVMATLTQLSTLGISIGPSVATAASTACGLLVGGLATYNFCNIYTQAGFVGNKIKGLLSLINETTAGVGIATCGGDIVACACP